MSAIQEFIDRWSKSGGSERANYALFLSELCDVLGLDRPLPATATEENDHYRLERPVASAAIGDSAKRFIDLYKRGCFVLETKQGTQATQKQDGPDLISDTVRAVQRRGHGVRGSRSYNEAMVRARSQADNYARSVAREDGWPPFLIVCDVGFVFEIFADFSGQGHGYTQFPDGKSFRIGLEDLTDPAVQDLLRTIWTDPEALNPARLSAKVTRQIADQLARLGKSFETRGHPSEKVASFLMRCLFSMFAEDVDLIPRGSFTQLLTEMAGDADNAHRMLQALWATMNTGGFSPVLRTDLLRFNGGLFADAEALPLDEQQIALLIGAARQDWTAVEPAIFGTLLERALDKRQRHKLGAHYTPRPYVERLVIPTVIEPLRRDWDAVRTSASGHMRAGKPENALKDVQEFHRKLCAVRVLDPACGSGNFLYVALELMKKLEGEVTELLEQLGQTQGSLGLEGHTVDPHQFLGIEVNPWAAKVAELVLWIGYLQWHFRTYGQATPAEPVLRDFHNIENRDAVLTWADRTPRMDDAGAPVTRWDGIGTVTHPVTGEQVPDPAARVQVFDYATPQAADWPEAEFIVGNPPFIGASRMRDALGDGYAEALWAAYKKMPQSADFVMFWWEKAALKLRAGNARRFGFITTNSLRQTFNRKVLEPHLGDPKKPASLIFAIPDHPWVDAGDGAAVRIAMTVAVRGASEGRLMTVASEEKLGAEAEGRDVSLNMERGKIFANLRIGADVAGAKTLRANSGLAHMGVKLHGLGFLLEAPEAKDLVGDIGASHPCRIRPYANGRDIAQTSRGHFVIDLFGLSEKEVRNSYPQLYQIVCDRVKPERDSNNRKVYRDNWWIFGEPRKELRPALIGIQKFIVTTRTAKHRLFSFLDVSYVPESKLVAIALEDASFVSLLSSKAHELFSLSAGGWLGVGNDPTYNHSDCFNPFPFPNLTDAQRAHLRALGEELDAHRKRQQAAHPKLTLTQMYNVLEKLRAGDRIEGKDKVIYDSGLIVILRDIHDRIDAAVADAYGWPADLSDDDILFRLVALNHERAAEEARGLVRWLRPEYQNPTGAQAEDAGEQTTMDTGPADTAQKAPWPKSQPEQLSVVMDSLAELREATPEMIARRFKRARRGTVEQLLEMLTITGVASQTEGGTYRSDR